jgi:hypothetical protein
LCGSILAVGDAALIGIGGIANLNLLLPALMCRTRGDKVFDRRFLHATLAAIS